MKEIEIYLKKFKSVIFIIVLALAVVIFLLTKIIPSATEYVKTQKQHTEAVTKLEDQRRTLEDMRTKMAATNAKEQKDKSGLAKKFFKPIEKGLDAESTIAKEFEEILELLRSNSIKTRSIKYEYNPADDNFVKNVASEYMVARLNSEMIGTYKNFEGFLKELYKHEHFLDISSIEIVPYQNDKKILIIKFQLKLYAQK